MCVLGAGDSEDREEQLDTLGVVQIQGPRLCVPLRLAVDLKTLYLSLSSDCLSELVFGDLVPLGT